MEYPYGTDRQRPPKSTQNWLNTGHRRFPTNKRYLCGPKLLNELSSTAKKLAMAKQPGWVSHNGGVQVPELPETEVGVTSVS